ncbi:MAG: tetratricopeptide repeat protein [Trichodesmium sp. St11_bin5]|nr:tetratricopeptide repeat protein [Trichodesmium sp. St11_bin5]
MSINYIIQGRKLDKEGRLEEAIACFKKSIEINPQFSWYYFYLGESLIKQKQNYEQ